MGLARDYWEGYEYYRVSPAKHPRSVNKLMFSRMDSILTYTALAQVQMCAPRPMLFIAGTQAGTRYFSEEAHLKVKEYSQLCLIEGATHIELYYKEPYVTQALDRLQGFFKEHLR